MTGSDRPLGHVDHEVDPETGQESGSEHESGPGSLSGPESGREPGELNPRELARWAWRQLTSMRTALILLLLLAVGAIPGSVIPQTGVDALKTSRWQEAHPKLTTIYERLGLFSVYDSVWFSAIYILLMISLVGCILPRTAVYWRAARATPPRAPRNLTRLADHAAYDSDLSPDEVLDRARSVLGRRRYRLAPSGEDGSVSAERGYLREAGNLLFHISVLLVLVGFAMGSLFGYKGGAIVVVGKGFSNTPTQYDDFVPGSLFDPSDMENFYFRVDDFEAEWLYSGPAAGTARKFVAPLTYRETPDGPERTYDLKVNHPLAIGGTEIFLIGHGYAPIITIRDGEGNIVNSGPTIFLPTDQQTFRSFGVVKAPSAKPTQIALDGEFYPTYDYTTETGPYSTFGDALNPAISMTVWTGDLNLGSGNPQSVYTLDRSKLTMLKKEPGLNWHRLNWHRPGVPGGSPGGRAGHPPGRAGVGVPRWL